MSKKDETRKYNSAEVNKKSAKKAKNKVKKNKSKGWKIFKILIILFLLAIVVACGALVGIFYGTFGDELKIEQSELVIPYENSTVYDKDGNFLATLSGGTKRKCITLAEMSEYLPKAYIAIEDERFYEHRGVDIKRTAAATFTYVIHGGDSSFGGSSITQQLVKNITNDKEDSGTAGVVRKIKEMTKAMQVEDYLSKDQILELYLNLIFIGGNDVNGVELGSIYYFNKHASELSIAECAYMAGINHSPNAYKPFEPDEDGKMKSKITKRTKTVLLKMKELKFINEEQYNTAIAEVDSGLKFQNGDVSPTIQVSYLVEAALEQIVNQVMEEKGMSQSLAETYVYSSGFRIYVTQDTAAQTALEQVISQEKYCTTSKAKLKSGEELVQNSIPTMVIMDTKTGRVVAASSATGEKGARTTTTKLGYLNIPTKIRKQTGSSMKPIAVIAPGLENGIITASTVYLDAPTTFGKDYTPKNYYAGFKGPMTIRSAIEISANIPHVKALSNIGLEKAIAFCQSVGLPKFENEGLSLALGGLSKGVTVTEMAGAYNAIANDGIYMEPIFYLSVNDSNNNVILQPKQIVNQVMTKSNAYIEKSILTQTVVGGSGTAKYCAIKGMSVAAKTGTTNDDYDRWLCGFTPYYTGVCWYGYETNSTVKYSGNPAGKIWDEVMTKLHENLEPAEFERPEDIVEVTVCGATGLRASETCTSVYKEVFVKGTEPSSCDGHTMAMICGQTGLLCCEGCPFGSWQYFNTLPPKERDAKWVTTGLEQYSGAAPTGVCPHTPSPLQAPTPATPVETPAPTPTETPSTTPTETTPTTTTNQNSSSTGETTTNTKTETTPSSTSTTQKQTTTTETTPTTNPTTQTTQTTTESTKTTTESTQPTSVPSNNTQ